MKMFAATNVSIFLSNLEKGQHLPKRNSMRPPKRWAVSLSRDPAMAKMDWTKEKMVLMMLVKTSKTEPTRSEKALTIADILGFVTSCDMSGKGVACCRKSGDSLI